jgi:molybdopterin-guanine dinucleotide biosynthesis protein
VKIISITSTSSGAGKTTLATFLIKILKGLNALKITVQHMGACPKEIDCDGCPTMGDLSFRIITNPIILRQPGKDTARYLKAGARKVIWLQTQRKCLEAAVQQALKLLPPKGKLLVEGNSFLSIKKVDFAIMITTPGTVDLKPSARKILDKINLFVINKNPGHTRKDIETAREKLLSLRPECPVVVLDPYHPEQASSDALLRPIVSALGGTGPLGVREGELVSYP